MKIELVDVDFSDTRQGNDLIFLLNQYAEDPMGGASPLRPETRHNLVAELRNIPGAFSIICYVDNKPAGLINCFEGFSTFQCKPLVNVHDVVVLQAFRGLGISRMMLEQVERIAKSRACCKLTLEVLEGNKLAQQAYLNYGFAAYELEPVMGRALFWEKKID